MTTSKGPWIYDEESGLVLTKDTTGDWRRDLAGPEIFPTPVCMVYQLDGISNGHLLAAAPEMRDALREFKLYEESMQADDFLMAMNAYAELKRLAYIALAKAER